MSATSRELVYQTLAFANPARAPRDLWALPWADIHHPDDLRRIREEYPTDFAYAPGFCREESKTSGDAYAIGTYTDPWGSVFENIQPGVIGEVKEALIQDWDIGAGKVHVPREWLTIDVDKINAFCAGTSQFVLASCCPRPFEQFQFLRGTADFYMDLLIRPEAMTRFLEEMHAFFCEQCALWAKTDVDALMFMDDWGSQNDLLIDPAIWREIFKPLYRDYIQIAHGAGKKAFMHSDGMTLSIYPDLIEIGLDAFNSQIFCIGVDALEPFAGKITFWGEVDRQHILPEGTTGDVAAAVTHAHAKLWRQGGCIAQCEFGAGAKPENVREVFAAWDRLTAHV